MRRILCLIGRHRWYYAEYCLAVDECYRGPLTTMLRCVRCGHEKFWEGE